MNLIELTRSCLKPEMMVEVATLVEGSPRDARRAAEAAARAIVAELAGEASSAHRLMSILDEAGVTGTTGGGSKRLPAGTGSVEKRIRRGRDLLERIFGARSSTMVDAAASACGVKTSMMSSMMGLATPIVLGELGHLIRSRQLDTSGLATLLEEQKGSIPSSASATLGAKPVARAPAPRKGGPGGLGRLWPVLFLVLGIVIAAILVRKRGARAEPDPDRVALSERAGIVVSP